MGVILDILGSFVVRAAIVVIILNLMINLHQSLSKNTDRIYLNQSISNAGNIIAADIKLAGFAATDTFAIARRRNIKFSADTGNNGTVQTIRYYTVPSIPSASAKAILYREVIGTTTQTLEIATNITDFNISYYIVTGEPINGLNVVGIKSIYITLVMESNITEKEYYAIDAGEYSTGTNVTPLRVKWERHFFPENL